MHQYPHWMMSYHPLHLYTSFCDKHLREKITLSKEVESHAMQNKTTEAYDIRVPVLIVGGSLVGLSMSLFLSWQGVPSLLVERHPEPARLPRARGYNARTMELFRALGLEETIQAAQSSNAANRGMLRVESLVGRVLAQLDEGGIPDFSLFSPSADCIIGQESLEPILIDA